MNIRNYIILFLFILIAHASVSQKYVDPSPIGWYTIEEADSLSKITPKPIFIDVYTDWCGWCKHMMKTTFANKSIAAYINTHFYPVKFNAEGFDTVVYKGKQYINKGGGARAKHEFANFILKGRFSFPTIVYIDKQNNMYPIPGYMDVKSIEPVLVYFTEEINYSSNYNDWETYYQFNFPERYAEEISKKSPSLYPDTGGRVNWLSFKDASEMSLKDQKPVFIFMYAPWCNSCKIFEGVVLKNPVIANMLNNEFSSVKFNAASQETQIFYGQEFQASGPNNPHKLAYALLQQSFKFPAIIIINEKKQKLNELHSFFLPDQLESILSYFAQKAYLDTEYNEFLKSFKSSIK
jgi:thioredoxin-related protein